MTEKPPSDAGSFRTALLYAFENRAALVVHGWARADYRGEGPYLPFAWNELENDVCDLAQHDRPVSRELFYRRHDIRENRIRRYTVQEAACMAVGTNAYGPWDHNLFGVSRMTREEIVERFGQ